jgi:DNA-binding LytR/AlgR family response regulator
MRVLVVETEPGTIENIRHLLTSVDDSITVIGAIPEVLDKDKWPASTRADVILVNRKAVKADKKLLLSRADLQTTVTFSSTLGEFSFQAFRSRTLEQLLQLPVVSAQANKQRFLVRQGQRLLPVGIEKIAYFFSDERFIFFKTLDNQKFLVDYRMEELERMLPPQHFYRVNRSFIISLQSIDHILLYHGNRLKISVKPTSEKEIIVSREKVSLFKSWLGD